MFSILRFLVVFIRGSPLFLNRWLSRMAASSISSSIGVSPFFSLPKTVFSTPNSENQSDYQVLQLYLPATHTAPADKSLTSRYLRFSNSLALSWRKWVVFVGFLHSLDTALVQVSFLSNYRFINHSPANVRLFNNYSS